MEGKENKNNSKQILLSVIGIAILIVAVVGVSFAAFTYSKVGTKINTISTGTITMSYDEITNGINIENAVPMTDEQGVALNASNEKFDFTVSATIVGNTTINYIVVAVPENNSNAYCAADQATVIGYRDNAGVEHLFTDDGATVTTVEQIPADANGTITNYTKCNTVPDANIKLYLEKSTDGTTYTAVSGFPKAYTADLTASEQQNFNAAAGMKLASGTFTANAGGASTTITDYYRLKMWVNNSYVVDGTARSYKVRVNVYGKGV